MALVINLKTSWHNKCYATLQSLSQNICLLLFHLFFNLLLQTLFYIYTIEYYIFGCYVTKKEKVPNNAVPYDPLYHRVIPYDKVIVYFRTYQSKSIHTVLFLTFMPV